MISEFNNNSWHKNNLNNLTYLYFILLNIRHREMCKIKIYAKNHDHKSYSHITRTTQDI